MAAIVFHRSTRSYPERLPKDDITIVAPQPAQRQAGGGFASWIQVMLPIAGTLSSVIFFLTSRSSPIMFIGIGVMITATVGGTIMIRITQARQMKKQAKDYRAKYVKYLANITTRLEELTQRQRAVNARLNPAATALPDLVTKRATLWERVPADEDFLRVRVGSGIAALCCRVQVDQGSNPLAEFDADLMTRAQAIVAKYAQVDESPVTLALRDLNVLVIQGPSQGARALVRSIMSQLATFHAPNDLRFIVALPPDATPEWAWLRWLPHTRRLRQTQAEHFPQGEPLCLLADTPATLQALLTSQIAPEIERRRKLNEGRDHKKNKTLPGPHFVIILDGYAPQAPIAHIPQIEEWMRDSAGLGVTLMCLVRETADSPAAAQARVSFGNGGWITVSETAYGGHRQEFITPDATTPETCDRLARLLAPLKLNEDGAQVDMADDVRLISLLGLDRPDDLDLTRLWQPRSRSALLRVPIGRSVDGEPLMLDIKESADGGMGPHGLIIGATGSGKSELLRTIVTSLAMTHDPETLNFILADFKGGASFADLAGLPHAAGMITNLQSDLSMVDRMRAALFGEQERRQRMLRELGNLDNIKQYQQKRLAQPEMEPMPYLMIIVDEFAELLANRPDFLDLFVAIGRVGRSLGMHLLLATQRLGEGRIQGLEGHLRYRICLRTFSAAESSAVLGAPDAFYLPSFPGIGYFKVDTTIYKQFKTALISIPSAGTAQAGDAPLLRAFMPLGTLVAVGEHHPAAKPSASDGLHTEMDVVIEQIHAQQGARAPVHQVWLPPLSTQLTLRQTLDLANLSAIDGRRRLTVPPFGYLNIPLGLVDQPSEQTQQPYILDFAGAGGHLALVGAPQSGKSTTLQTLLMALMVTHTPQDVQIYAIDLGGGLLRAFEDAPHVGTVCGKGDRDKTRRLIRQMRSIIEAREITFREHRLDGIASFRERRRLGDLRDTPFGDVFLFIDDLAQLQNDIEGIDAEIMELATTGLAYGVHLIIASNRWSDIKPKLRDMIGARLELRLNDPSESEMGKTAAMALLPAAPGRGLMKAGQHFQVALPSVEHDGALGRAAIDALITAANPLWAGQAAPKLRMLPAHFLQRDLPIPGTDIQTGVPLGIDEFQLDPIYLDLTQVGPHFVIFGDGECGKTNLLRLWLKGIEQRYSPEQVQFALIDNRRTLIDVVDSPHLLAYACTPPMLKELLEKLRASLDGRMLIGANLTLEELRKPREWIGPRYILFVDDYETVITPSGNPLAQLLDIVSQARDIGFHLVLARRVSGTSRTGHEPLFQRIKEMGTPALIMSGDPQEGALIGTQRALVLPAGRGVLIRRNKQTMLMQAALAES